MRIGVLTQPLNTNFGGALQNWALQQVLKNMGHKPMMLNIVYKRPVDFSSKVQRVLSCIKITMLKCCGRGKHLRLMSPFQHAYYPGADWDFFKKISKTNTIANSDDLERIISECDFDAFIVGSDQVWRQEYSPRIESYFLDFLPYEDKRPRIAYAASFGTSKLDMDTDKIPLCKHLLKRFTAVSVREQEGLNLVKRDLGRQQVVQTLDPTLLLPPKKYLSLINPSDLQNNDCIASYILDPNHDKQAILKDIMIFKGFEEKNELKKGLFLQCHNGLLILLMLNLWLQIHFMDVYSL